MRQVVAVIILLLLTACSSPVQVMPEPALPTTLRNPWTRQIIRCDYNPLDKSCVSNLQNQGFEKIEHTTFLPAKYDFQVEGSYPARRWRENEIVPRW
ncbi:MAG: hypothetical protein AB7U85_00825 [Alphaproteobacteria bacterium]